MFIVKGGELEVSTPTGEGEDRHVALLTDGTLTKSLACLRAITPLDEATYTLLTFAGAFFGEMSLLTGDMRRSVTAQQLHLLFSHVREWTR